MEKIKCSNVIATWSIPYKYGGLIERRVFKMIFILRPQRKLCKGLGIEMSGAQDPGKDLA